MKNVIGLHEAASNGTSPYKVDFKEGRTGKKTLILPPTPEPDDIPGLCQWLTEVLARDPAYPITGASRRGAEGPEGQLIIHRAGDAPDLYFEPARHINSPARLGEALTHYRAPLDRRPHTYTTDHCTAIAYVAGSLAGASKAETVEQEAEALVGAFTQYAEAVVGFTTRGTRGQTFEAATALRRDIDDLTGKPKGIPRFLVEGVVQHDIEQAELTLPVGDFTAFARNYLGRSLPRGYLDSRMEALGWERFMLDAHAMSGREGRRSAHAHISVYRGRLEITTNEESVTP